MEDKKRKILVDILKADKVTMDNLKEEHKELREKIVELEDEIWKLKMNELELEIEEYLEMYESNYAEMDEEMKQAYDKACAELAKALEV